MESRPRDRPAWPTIETDSTIGSDRPNRICLQPELYPGQTHKLLERFGFAKIAQLGSDYTDIGRKLQLRAKLFDSAAPVWMILRLYSRKSM
jgi:hypothetical protein